MLETIIVLWFLARRISKIVREKGYSNGRYIVLTIVLGVGGWFFGLLIGWVAVTEITGDAGIRFVVYLCALLGALLGAGMAYGIANNLEPVTAPTPALSGS